MQRQRSVSDIGVSEGLNSVETNILTNTRNYPDWVSEELNSVETFFFLQTSSLSVSFQKNLIVWKLMGGMGAGYAGAGFRRT